MLPSPSYHKHDLAGRPLYIERSGSIDVAKVVGVIDEDALVARHFWQMFLIERKCEQVRWLHGAETCAVRTHTVHINNV